LNVISGRLHGLYKYNQKEDQSFSGSARNAKADLQFADWNALTWRTPMQRMGNIEIVPLPSVNFEVCTPAFSLAGIAPDN
jgi:hypothetical protein